MVYPIFQGTINTLSGRLNNSKFKISFN